jgi:hypothetical protein
MKGKLILIIGFLLFINNVSASSIKVAVLDNPLAKWTSEKYRQYYLNGLNIAQIEANKLGITYEYKVFSYKEPAINIFSVVQDVKKWHPDIVIGPCASEHFLLLKEVFNSILVLSPYASATDVYKLPNNFYTLAVPAEFSANKTFKYMQKLKPKHIYVFTDLECKACTDFINSLYRDSSKVKIKTIRVDFINSNLVLNQINYKNILRNYAPSSDIVILNCTGYGAGVLMGNISNIIKKYVTYIGGDSWGTYKDWSVAKIDTPYPYRALRITPMVVDLNSLSVKYFIKLYKKQYQESPDTIAYVMYNTLVSVTHALQKYNCHLIKNSDDVLCSYRSAILKNPRWHRPVVHEVYQITKTKELFITGII